MVLTTEDIRRAIIDNPSKAVLNKAVEKTKLYRMHMYGENMESYLPLIKGFEEDALHKLRAKYAKSNKDLFARLGRPIDKVFSARGGSIYYNLSEDKEKQASVILSNVKGGMSVKKWVHSYWLPHFLDDPDGIIMMEVGDGYAYPTYKSCTAIYGWQTNGNRFEYLIFKLSTEEKKAAGIDGRESVYRVIDDAYDQYIKMVNNVPVIIDGQTYPNIWGMVPAIRNSDFIDPNQEGLMLSFFDSVIELADEFLLKGSVKITHEFMHAYPKYWEFADDCDRCKSTGKVNNKTCPDCNGSGKSHLRNVSRVKLLNWPQDNTDPNPAPDLGGYIEPSETYHNIATTGLQMLEDAMHYTIWNKEPSTRTQGLEANKEGVKTATEVIEGQSPMNERLHSVSDVAEKIMKFIIDSIIEAEVKVGYTGASVNLGRRYISENTDTIWKRYVQAKMDAAPAVLLDELYREYIESKYATDPYSMDLMIKLMGVEPFRHFGIEQVKTMGVGEDVYKQKVYYSEWLNEKNDDELLQNTVEQLREDLAAYANKKELAPEPEPGQEKKKEKAAA